MLEAWHFALQRAVSWCCVGARLGGWCCGVLGLWQLLRELGYMVLLEQREKLVHVCEHVEVRTVKLNVLA